MTDLDDLDLERLDPAGMLATVERSAEMWREAIAAGMPDHARELPRPAGVVIAGMGGSGIAGDVGALAADLTGAVPVAVVKGYRLPAWVTPEHLVVGVSHSGNTEETLAVVDAAARRGSRIVVVTSGGELARVAGDHDWGVSPIPGGHQPRASLPYLAVPVLRILEAVGALSDGALSGLAAVPDHVAEAVARWGRQRPVEDNVAKHAARELHGRIPVFYGGRGVAALVAARAKCQVNENAEAPAFHNEVPERDHNELVGWGADPGPFALVELRSPADEPPGVRRRFSAAEGEIAGPLVRLWLEGDTWLGRLAGGVVLVDLLSVYLAFLRGVDPTPVAPIERLKQRIATEAERA